ncbi:MAG TPA: hypothetical protein VE988_12920 [Gemmataceae bacterium]|nr:hypothetical protein [Gemmataceae bacterium]
MSYQIVNAKWVAIVLALLVSNSDSRRSWRSWLLDKGWHANVWLSLLAGQASGTAASQKKVSSKGKTPLEQNDDLALQGDIRLRVRLSVRESPTLEGVLAALHEATGLDFTLEKNLQYHQPQIGKVFIREAYAWVFMSILAEADLENGHWEMTETGYRLTGKSLALRVPPKIENAGPDFALWLAFGVLVLLIGGVLFHQKFIKKARLP